MFMHGCRPNYSITCLRSFFRSTVPYWDWSKDEKHWARDTETNDVWNLGPHGLGGDGTLSDDCVRDGPFKKDTLFVLEDIRQGCLQRRFNISCFLPGEDVIQKITKDANFTAFEKFVREKVHPAFHDCVGGHMLKHHSASFSPEFWIHHSFIDKLWADWQMNGASHTFEYFINIPFEMPLSGWFSWNC